MIKKIVKCLKLLYKVLPILNAALGGGALACVSGCKIGSLVSLASPAI